MEEQLSPPQTTQVATMISKKNLKIRCDQIGLKKFSIFILYRVVEELYVKNW